ncbi:MAG: xanthine dehydrogenase molybdopterin binding subunit, partial [Xanthomonadales bacterium]|nr:xanthine dehydrogenase molybdopterin binding subunit [Xanthomonadales bacterium]
QPQVQHAVDKVLGLADHADTVDNRRMGGAFGGKEIQASWFAVIAAALAQRSGRPVKYRLDRDDDMIMTGKRQSSWLRYRVGFDDDGRILGIDQEQAADGGYSPDLSDAVAYRAMYHADNAYYLEHVRITAHRCRTNKVSNTAFRGFGGPQGMAGMEHIIDHIARYLGRDPLEIRKLNFYGKHERNVTPYGQTLEDNIINELVADLESSAHYAERRSAIRAWNATSPWLKKGLALTPIKFGIAFTTKFHNQGAALVLVYRDGSVQLNHGGTEMGQGLHIKVAQVVAEAFGIDLERIRITTTTTGKVPNASATSASTGTDLNAAAAYDAALKIVNRLRSAARDHYALAADECIEFRDNSVYAGERRLGSFADIVDMAYFARVPLSATGFHVIPKIWGDDTGGGHPFHYFAYGAAVAEVLVDTLTGEYRMSQVDILHDVGHSLNPAIDRGQIEGGFIQGVGWLTTEELWWNERGRIMTHSPSTYKIPTCSDVPVHFRTDFYQRGESVDTAIFRSKAVGEPPLMLAPAVLHAIRDAIAAVDDYRHAAPINAPATPEAVLLAIQTLRKAAKLRAATAKNPLAEAAAADVEAVL